VNPTTEKLLIFISILSQLFWPLVIVGLVFVFYVVYRTGSFGKFDLNSAFQKKYDIRAGEGSMVSIGPDIPLNSEGKIDQRELAKRSLVLVQQYHAQGLQQSNISFWFSIISAALGFVVIVYGALLILSPQEMGIDATIGGGDQRSSAAPDVPIIDRIGQPILVMISGVIIDAVAALFFVQSNNSRKLMSDFFDRLRKDRKLDEALMLIRDIKRDEIAGRTQAILAINLAEIGIDGPMYDRVIVGRYQSSAVRQKNAEGIPAGGKSGLEAIIPS
jgi:hypothetical protein